MKNKQSKIVVVAKCIACKKKREIKAGEIAPGDMPFCECGNVMVAVSAKNGN